MLSRNAELNNWGVPTLEYNRNPIELEYNHKTTFKAGDLVPFYCNPDVLPGETYKMNMSLVCRMLTPYYPVMDNAFLDVYFFALPWVNCWDHCKEFFGEDLMTPFESTTEYTIPIIKSNGSVQGGSDYFETPENAKNLVLKAGTILDHLGGLPIGKGFETDRFGLNTYLNVYNNYFRDQNLIAPIKIDKSDADMIYDGTSETGGKLLKVAKTHDYFTSLLIEPQKGVALTMPIGTEAPVKGDIIGRGAMSLVYLDNNQVKKANLMTYDLGGAIMLNGQQGEHKSLDAPMTTGQGIPAAKYVGLSNYVGESGVVLHNATADLSDVIGATLNAQRPIIAISHIQEKMGLYGSRYNEYMRWGFGVNSPSLMKTLGIAEYLGGKRIPINIETVLNTTQTSTQLGDTGAYSITADADYMFTWSSEMHSTIIGVMCVRNDQTYSQGIDARHLRRRRYDVYDNDLKGLGMQPVYNKEINYTGNKSQDDKVLGYKPAWQEYRTEINHVSGLMRPDAPQNLAKWTYANNFKNTPVLSQEFIEQPSEQIDNTLKQQNTDQFFIDINLQYLKMTEIPQWHNPGLDKF